jgi:hypothetical protein
VIFDRHGKIAEESSTGYADLSKELLVFVKVNLREVIKVYIVKYLLSFPLLKKTFELSHTAVIRSLSTRWH